MNRPGGLGRGLGALIPTAAPGESGLVQVPVAAIRANPRQPRRRFEGGTLDELAASIRQVGVLQPVVVRPLGAGCFELVAGERRVRAARLAGLDEIPAVVRHTEDADLLTEALVENLHRADLDPLEEAAAYQQLIDDFGLTHERLAARLGRSRATISNALRLLALPPGLRAYLADGRLSAGHARALLGLANGGEQERLGRRVVTEGLSVRATEELVRRVQERDPGEPADSLGGRPGEQRRASPYPSAQRRLSDVLGTKVQISGNARRGRIVIDYAGEQDLQRLLDVLGSGREESLDGQGPQP